MEVIRTAHVWVSTPSLLPSLVILASRLLLGADLVLIAHSSLHPQAVRLL